MSKLKIIQIEIDLIKPWEKNPRLNTAAIDPVAKSIQEFGFNVPILINEENQIIAGHTRLLAAQKLGMTEIPAIRLEHLSDVQQKAFNIADNKTNQYATWNDDLLKEIFTELQNSNYDLANTSFSVPEIENIMSGWSSDIEKLNSISENLEGIPAKITITCHQDIKDEVLIYIKAKLLETSFEGVHVK